MKLKAIIEKLNLKVLTAQEKLDKEVTGGYTSDLLSDVIANSKEGDLWITLQTHQNIIAVAKLKDLAGIVIVSNREPDEDTQKKAQEESVPLMISGERAFEISGKLYGLIGS
ncbi:MAG: serine kinase [Candidatus Aminicenantes bacterium]|nr:serine kinase [Candidatus Aminicenantes bacterium]MDH5706304.1 serine kinase [Candidatus Aminicenantes bacterium]